MSKSLLFNPAQASTEELERTFVGRHELLKHLEQSLLQDQKAQTPRHWQFIGPRGSGKSHLTELLSRFMRGRHAWRVARLPEENYKISTLGELFEQILIRSENGKLGLGYKGLDNSLLQERVLDILRERAVSSGAPLLVVLENLSALFERQLRSSRDQARLRDILTNNPPFILLATSTSQSEATTNHSSPFFDFFHTTTLEDLTPSDITELVRARANWEHNASLLAKFDEIKGRLEAIYHLSGGNPRLALALYRVVQSGVTTQLHEQVMDLLDEITPYYQARLNDIPPQAVRILTEMAISDTVTTPAEIARRCRMSTNQVTAQIANLIEERLIVHGGRPDARSRYYEFKDRLLRIWIQMRESASAERRLRFLVEFFERWYSGHVDELKQDSKRAMSDFWSGLAKGNERLCVDQLKTLSYLAEIKPGFDDSIVLQTMVGHVKETSESDVRAHLEALKRTFDQTADLREREAVAFLLSQCYLTLDSEQECQQYLQTVIREGSQSETIAKRYMGGLVSAGAWAKAWKFGSDWLSRLPEHLTLTGPLAIAALSDNKLEKGLSLLRQYVNAGFCRHCIEGALKDAIKILQRQRWPIERRREFWQECLAGDSGIHASDAQIQATFKIMVAKKLSSVPSSLFLEAAAAWQPLSNAPHWFLANAVCTLSHRVCDGSLSLSFISAIAEKKAGPLDQSVVDHLVQVVAGLRHLRDDSEDAAAAYFRAIALVRKRTRKSSLAAGFGFIAPVIAKHSPEAVPDLISLYADWLREGLIANPITPYSEALEVLAAESRSKALQALHPEIRDAVSLLLGTAPFHDEPKGEAEESNSRLQRAHN